MMDRITHKRIAFIINIFIVLPILAFVAMVISKWLLLALFYVTLFFFLNALANWEAKTTDERIKHFLRNDFNIW
jgi:predicted membrane protein